MSEVLVKDHYPFASVSPPQGWVVCSLSDVASNISSGFPSGAHNSEGRGIPHVRPMNIDREGRFDLSETKFVEVEAPRLLQKGDILFNNTNSPDLIGKTTVVPTDVPLAYSNHMTRIPC